MSRRYRGRVIPVVGAVAGFVLAMARGTRRGQGVARTLGPHRQNTPSRTGDGDDTIDGDALGRRAKSPRGIPARGWWQVLKRTAAAFSANDLMSEAASVTFYALLALVPAITALVSIYGLVSDPSSIADQLRSLSSVVPSGGMEIISEQVHRLVQSSASGLGFGLVIGIGTAIWSANAATKAMFGALNRVYGETEQRGFVRFTLTSLAFTAGGIVTLVLGGVLIVVIPVLFKAIGLSGVIAVAIRVLRVPAMLLLIVVALAILYRFGPSRTPPKWRWVTWGGTIAALGWVALSVAFSWYVANFGSYNKTYGSLGAIVGFMTWIWLSTTVLLAGAQIDAELEKQTSVDSTVGTPKPLGARGAKAADVVA